MAPLMFHKTQPADRAPTRVVASTRVVYRARNTCGGRWRLRVHGGRVEESTDQEQFGPPRGVRPPQPD